MTKRITPRLIHIWKLDPLRIPYPDDGHEEEGCVVPVPPLLLWATDIATTSFTLNWQASITPETDGYRIDISESSIFDSFLPGFENREVGDVLSYPVSGLTRFTNYYIRVRAYDQGCISANSNIVVGTTSGEYVPVATPATNVIYNSFTANWLEFAEPVITYYLDVATDAGFSMMVPGFDNLDVGDVLFYDNITGLDPNTPYYYRVRAETSDYLSDNSNIITVTTEQIYTACASFTPDFNTPLVSAMFLTADVLVLGSGVLSYYAIDWRLGSTSGSIVFTSGVTADLGEVQAQHPFTDEVVFAGTLYPVIKYIYVDGIKYTSVYEAGSRYSPDLIACLDPVVITAVDCSTVLGADTSYPYFLQYNNVTDTGLDKSRKIKFYISSNTAYFAWDLRGYEVAEQIKIYYCTLLDSDGVLIDNFIHGSQISPGVSLPINLVPADYPNNPRTTNANSAGFSPSLAFITKLDAFTYMAGDYLRIEIIGSVYEPTVTNTNWWVKFKCLTAADMNCGTFICDTGMSKITSTPVISYISDPTCQYRISYNTLDNPFTTLPARSSSLSALYKYNSGFYYWYGPTGGNPAGNSFASPVNFAMRWIDQSSSYSMHVTIGRSTCMNLAPGQTISIWKDTNTFVITFSDITDYNKYVSDINSFHLDPDYITWTGLTDSDERYYAHWSWVYRFAASCGDTYNTIIYYFWWGAPIAFDAIAKTITITMTIPVNTFINVDCNNAYETINNYISTSNATKNAVIPVGQEVSNVRMIGMVYGTWIQTTALHDIQREIGFGMFIHNVMLNGICDLTGFGFCSNILTNYWVIVKYWDRVTFTDPTDHASRLANWRLERKIGCRTDVCTDYETADWEIVHEVP